MTLTQRQINHGVFGVLAVGGLLLWISAQAGGFDSIATLEILIATLLTGGLWGAYWRGWEPARYIVTILLTVMVGVGIPDVTKQFDPLIFIPPLIALILTGPQWMLASAIATIGVLLVRANGQGVYADTSNLIEYSVIIIGMAFSGLAADNARRLAEARAQAEQARALAEQQAQQLERQASELIQRNAAQQRLLDLVAELETPAVQLANGVLFVPIVGHLDSRRAQALTGRLLAPFTARPSSKDLLSDSVYWFCRR